MIARILRRLDIAGLLKVAEERLGIEKTAVDRARVALYRYDAESERLLAETDGRVKSLKARLRFGETGMSASGPVDPETVVALRRELQQAEEDNNGLLVHRLEGRDAVTGAFSDAAQRMLAAGGEILELAGQAEQFAVLTADLPTTSVEAEPVGRAS